jgi:UDP-2,3-diacylglucosamine pyrophosphatase LpxH
MAKTVKSYAMKQKKCRTIWISDIHLGTKGCKAELLNHFLKSFKCENLFLVGDIIDGWRLSTSKWFWPDEHNRVIRQILRKSEKDQTNVMYIVGNHDEFLREYLEEHTFQMGNIRIANEAYYETAAGKKLWIIHGDAYDGITRHHKWVALAGDVAYNFLLWSNRWFNQIRRFLKLPYWSLSQAIKHKVKKAVSYIFEFEKTVAREAVKRRVDGVVCGHIHHAEKKTINGIDYFNCGDWVESCTAVIEDMQGNMEILNWINNEQVLQPTVFDGPHQTPDMDIDRKVA